ncbi:MAG: hypothetical protein ABI703_11340 [Gemmatimonadales bacterium]
MQKILNVMRYDDAGPGPKGTVMIGRLALEPDHHWRSMAHSPTFR